MTTDATTDATDLTDLLALTAQLVDIPSVSHEEQALVDLLEHELRALPWLETTRVGDNLVARTLLGRSRRVLLGGHSDTVPPAADNARARSDGSTLWGVGTADMKGGLAVMLELARTVREPAVDVTYVIYAREEVALVHSGLRELERERPDLLAADVAILGEEWRSDKVYLKAKEEGLEFETMTEKDLMWFLGLEGPEAK